MVTIEGHPWFVAADVCRCLELGWDKTNNVYAPSRVIGFLGSDERGSSLIATSGKLRAMLTISESGLYKLIMRSDKPQARAFQDWVTREVLPSIRKTGAYVEGQPSLVENPDMDPLSLLMAQAQLRPSTVNVTDVRFPCRGAVCPRPMCGTPSRGQTDWLSLVAS